MKSTTQCWSCIELSERRVKTKNVIQVELLILALQKAAELDPISERDIPQAVEIPDRYSGGLLESVL